MDMRETVYVPWNIATLAAASAICACGWASAPECEEGVAPAERAPIAPCQPLGPEGADPPRESGVTFAGDFRFRLECIGEQGADRRDRFRIRARLNAHARSSDEMEIGLGLATGSGDPVSTNQTLDEGFSTKDFRLDLAFFDFHPRSAQGLHVVGGKMKNPLYSPAKTELLWDSDLRPEGLVVTYGRGGGRTGLFASAGAFFVDERKDEEDAYLFAAQAAVDHQFGSGVRVKAGTGYYDFTNLRGFKPVFEPSDGFGNSLDPSGNYATDFNEFEAFAEVAVSVSGVPVSLFGNWVTNAAADSEDQGWLVGFTVGELREVGSWMLRYNYRDVEKDAVLGIFTDSDFRGGGTDARGHEIGIDYQVWENGEAGVTLFLNDIDLTTGKHDYSRLQLDLAFKF
jgi:hypothetical protein